VINFNDNSLLSLSLSLSADAFDVYNIETALPVIDLEAIESHLMASAKAEEMKVGCVGLLSMALILKAHKLLSERGKRSDEGR
jgi:hypothetical protein